MATEGDDDDIQNRMREWMEAAQSPQLPLSNAELKKVRLLLDTTEKTRWLRKQIYVAAPWITTVVISLAAGWRWIVEFITGHKT